jgi:hypothetical protein
MEGSESTYCPFKEHVFQGAKQKSTKPMPSANGRGRQGETNLHLVRVTEKDVDVRHNQYTVEAPYAAHLKVLR